jgi:oligoendopeptidase F
VKPVADKLQRKFLESPYRAQLESDDKRFHILARQWQADVDIFRDANVPLETEATKIVTDYDKISGAMMVTYRGKEYTLPADGAVRRGTGSRHARRGMARCDRSAPG